MLCVQSRYVLCEYMGWRRRLRRRRPKPNTHTQRGITSFPELWQTALWRDLLSSLWLIESLDKS